MAEGITGWRLHVGVIFPTPVPPRAVLEFYEAVPEGIDMTTVSLTTSFLRPVKAGDVLVTASILRRGRNLIFGEIELHDEACALAAHATTTVMLLA